MKLQMLLAFPAIILSSITAYADDSYNAGNTQCPPDYLAQADLNFGTGTSAITTCIAKRHYIRNVFNMSTNVLNPKSGIAQTLNNTVNMVANYKNVYGIDIGEDFQMNVVAHFQGAQFLLTDAAYNTLHNVTTGNPSRATVESLLAQGVHFYICQNTMRSNGWMTADVIPGVEEVPSGVVALADFAHRGWAVITP
jgi:intracellular sulfur oxidation DsrE/DsrF family protein